MCFKIYNLRNLAVCWCMLLNNGICISSNNCLCCALVVINSQWTVASYVINKSGCWFPEWMICMIVVQTSIWTLVIDWPVSSYTNILKPATADKINIFSLVKMVNIKQWRIIEYCHACVLYTVCITQPIHVMVYKVLELIHNLHFWEKNTKNTHKKKQKNNNKPV